MDVHPNPNERSVSNGTGEEQQQEYSLLALKNRKGKNVSIKTAEQLKVLAERKKKTKI